MQPLLLLIPIVIVVVTVLYGVVHALVRAWLDYRLRLAFLAKLERNPALLNDPSSIHEALSGISLQSGARQQYSFTGLLLAAIGVTCIITGRMLRLGGFAVGAYLGGIVCVLFGLVLAILGFLIHRFSRRSQRGRPRVASLGRPFPTLSPGPAHLSLR